MSARAGFHLHHQLRGKKSGGDPDESALLTPQAGRRRTACATWIPHHGGGPAVEQSRRCSNLRRPSKSSWLAGLENKATYILPRACFVRRLPRTTSKGETDSVWASRTTISTMPQRRASGKLIIRSRIYETVY